MAVEIQRRENASSAHKRAPMSGAANTRKAVRRALGAPGLGKPYAIRPNEVSRAA
jgi:hypothetical protein